MTHQIKDTLDKNLFPSTPVMFHYNPEADFGETSGLIGRRYPERRHKGDE